MSQCPVQGFSNRGLVPYNQFYEINEMRPLAQDILNRYSCNKCGKVKQITRFVGKHFAYITDQEQFGLVDFWMFPTEIVRVGSGDCDCLSFFTASLLEAVNIPTRVCIGNSPFGYHAWVECVDDDGSAYLVEATRGKVYPLAHRTRMGYFPDLYINPVGCAEPGEPVKDDGSHDIYLGEL